MSICCMFERIGRMHEVAFTYDGDLGDDFVYAIYRFCRKYLSSSWYEVAVYSDDDTTTSGTIKIDGGRFGSGTWEIVKVEQP